MSIVSAIQARLRRRQRAWFGIAGHGLRLSPRCPVQVEQRSGGTLLIGRGSDGGIVTVVPGTEPARRPPSRVETERGDVTYCCDARGPMIVPSHNESLDETFIHVETGHELGAWSLLGSSFCIAFPEGFAVVAPELDDRNPFFELHLAQDAPESSFIRFLRVPRRDSTALLERSGGPQWSRVTDGQVADHSWVEFSYEQRGALWHQRRYCFAIDDDACVLALAQGLDGRATSLFAGADEVARSFSPVVSS